MIYGYARVSTNGQAKDGNGLEVQTAALTENGATIIFKDKFTGTKKHRPEFDKLSALLKSGDTLIVTKLDRIARSTLHGTQIISELLECGVKINVLNLGIIDDTPNGKLIRTVLFAFAEWERDMIVERTSEGKAVAKLDPSFREGRPKKELPDFQKIFKKQKDGEITVLEACTLLGISKTQWYRCVREVA